MPDASPLPVTEDPPTAARAERGHAGPDRFALIIGAMKCGTTSLFSDLAQHPEIAPCRTKEPDFFCRADWSPEDLDAYRALWGWDPERHKVALEASANYTKLPSNPDCAERIARCGLDARFIYCMRNPLERIESHIYHGLYAGWTRPLDQGGLTDHVIDCSRYAMQLDAYSGRFGRAAIALVVLERFNQERADTLRRLARFLDVDPAFGFRDLSVAHNAAGGHFAEHPALSRLRAVAPLRSLAGMVPERMRRTLRRATGRRLQVRRLLDPEERASVLRRLEPDLLRLRDHYDIDAAAVWGLPLP